MCTSTLVVADACRLQPEMVIGLVTAAPASGICTSVPLVPLQPPPPPPVTVSANVALWLVEPAVPVTVRLYVPAGVLAEVVTVSFDEPPAVSEVGLSVAVAPAGAPVTLRVIVGAVPEPDAAVLIVAVTLPPGAVDAADGDTDREKSPGGGGGGVLPLSR